MHCEDEEKECSKKIFKAPTLADAEKFAEEANKKNDIKITLVPTCEVCGNNMKPHSMFFDESYSEHYYRYKTVSDFVKEADCLIVVGTALQTGFAQNIVKTLLVKEDAPVIEVNLETSIGRGYNL